MATNEAIGGRYLPQGAVPGAATPVGSGPRSSDLQAIEAAAKGDHTAFAYLFETRSRNVGRYVHSILRDSADAEEAVAEVFVTAWKKLRKLREPERFDAWLFRIAHNRAMDSLRKRRVTEPIDNVALSRPDPNPRNNPEDSLELAIQQEAVHNALLRLPDEQREVLTLRFMAEMSHAEVAVQLGKSEEAVRASQYRALKSLREMTQANVKAGR